MAAGSRSMKAIPSLKMGSLLLAESDQDRHCTLVGSLPSLSHVPTPNWGFLGTLPWWPSQDLLLGNPTKTQPFPIPTLPPPINLPSHSESHVHSYFNSPSSFMPPLCRNMLNLLCPPIRCVSHPTLPYLSLQPSWVTHWLLPDCFLSLYCLCLLASLLLLWKLSTSKGCPPKQNKNIAMVPHWPQDKFKLLSPAVRGLMPIQEPHVSPPCFPLTCAPVTPHHLWSTFRGSGLPWDSPPDRETLLTTCFPVQIHHHSRPRAKGGHGASFSNAPPLTNSGWEVKTKTYRLSWAFTSFTSYVLDNPPSR